MSVPVGYRKVPAIDRFLAKCAPPDENGCVMWTSAVGPDGYARFSFGGRQGGAVLAHRWAYEHFVGPIPQGLDVDHTCHNGSGCPGGRTCMHRRCVNHDHLEPATRRENLLRGESSSAHHARQTHCIHGHEFTPENTYRRPGHQDRRCRTCIRSRWTKEES